MRDLAQSRRFVLPEPALRRISSFITAERALEEETAAAIRNTWRDCGYLLDPHTAVAVAVAEKEHDDRTVPMVVLSTAHPSKFPEAVEAASGVRPELPEYLGGLMNRRERFEMLPPDQPTVESYIRSQSRAARRVVAA
jgi:threonine synthase